MKTALWVIGIILVIGIIGYFIWQGGDTDQETPEYDRVVSYECANRQELTIRYGDQLAEVELDNGITYTLEQTETPSGELYSNEGNQTVLFVEGRSAFLEENGVVTYSECEETSSQEVTVASGEDVHEYFRNEVYRQTIERVGQPIEGFEPFMFLKAFPGLKSSDFEGVEAELGIYHDENGEVVYEEIGAQIHTAARAITEEGMDTLFENVRSRLSLHIESTVEVDMLLAGID